MTIWYWCIRVHSKNSKNITESSNELICKQQQNSCLAVNSLPIEQISLVTNLKFKMMTVTFFGNSIFSLHYVVVVSKSLPYLPMFGLSHILYRYIGRHFGIYATVSTVHLTGETSTKDYNKIPALCSTRPQKSHYRNILQSRDHKLYLKYKIPCGLFVTKLPHI